MRPINTSMTRFAIFSWIPRLQSIAYLWLFLTLEILVMVSVIHHRFSAQVYDQTIEAGNFTENDPVELINGEIIKKNRSEDCMLRW